MSDVIQGTCSCGNIRYQLNQAPLFIHCCHCTWCQRESGSAFAINALIETASVELLEGEPEALVVPSNSGKGQKILRCQHCNVTLWSHYVGAGESLSFIRVGSLLQAPLFAPDIHIFTESKLPWVVLPENIPAVAQYYRASQFWPASSLERRAKLQASAT